MRTKLVNIFLIFTAIIFSIVVAEIGLRVFTSISPRSGSLKPRATAKKLAENTVVIRPNYVGKLIAREFEVSIRINSLGFRERECDFTELSSQRPYFFVGDSCLWGWGVERKARMTECFSEKLRSQHINIPVVNFSFPGYGTYQYFNTLKFYASKLNPRLAIINFFVGNDFLDDFNTLIEGQERKNINDQHFLGRWPLKAKSRLRSFLRSSPLVNTAKYSLWNFSVFRHIFNKWEIKNDRIVLYENKDSPLQERLYLATFAAFDEIAKFSKKSNMPVLVIIIPDHLQVIANEIFLGYDLKKPQKRLGEYLNKIGIPYIDILDFFINTEKPQRLYFRHDKHWNEEGNSFVSTILFENIIEKQK